MPTRCLLVLISISFALTAGAGFAAGDPYLGVRHEQVADPPGLLVSVVPGAPAALSGLQTGDIITEIGGTILGDSERPYNEILTEEIAKLGVGDVLPVTVYRDSPRLVLTKDGEQVFTDFPLVDLPKLIESAEPGELIGLTARRHAQEIVLHLVLGVRPGTDGEPFPPNSELAGDTSFFNDSTLEIREFLNALVDAAGNPDDPVSIVSEDGACDVRADTDDLLRRLDARATPDDGYKLSHVVYLLRDGLSCEIVTRLLSEKETRNLAAGGRPDYWVPGSEGIVSTFTSGSENGGGAGEELQKVWNYCNWAAKCVHAAFNAYNPEELEFIESQRHSLSDSFAQIHYVDSEDENKKRAIDNSRLIGMADKIDASALEEAMAHVNLATSDLVALENELKALFKESLDKPVLYEEDTEHGRIVITGVGESWFTGPQPALHIDLGGDDFYTYTEGGGASLDTPVGIIIELGGNDAYESTTPFCQGSGSMGVSLLVDTEGNDNYIGLQWAQGCGYFGCGALLDMSGDDVYRGEEFCQAAAIFGTGLLLDYAGDDRYEAQMKSQAFGGSRGLGLLIDVSGDDYRYCKGKYPTGYGDPGIFDAWGQGCAMGFRGLASGGIAGVIDMGGSDYNEAGNFSQGGGYYFGYGFFHDMGWEDDVYIGSRYNQGFSAHQAVGVFLEEGGDDRYHTRQAVAQGLACDECVTMFIDYGGDDHYSGGTGFSQGASAHNSLCVMWDKGGRDSYDYAPGQARAGGNDYHGGTSLSLFIDEGGDLDWYNSAKAGNDRVTGWPEHGFFADLPGSLEAALEDSAWRRLWVYEKD